MRQLSDELCREESLSTVPSNGAPEMRIHRGAARAMNEGRLTIQSIVKEDVDCCIQTATTLEEWFSLMRDKGYQIDDSGKYLRVFPYGHSRCIRLDRRFGDAYTLDGIASQISQKTVVHKVKTEDEAIKDIFRELSKGTRRKHKHPRGIQVYYIRFLFRIGYRKTPAQIARTHYLLREELTKLDRYIEESKFLIYEDISTLEQLQERRVQDQTVVNQLYRSKRNLQRMLPDSNQTETEAALGQIKQIDMSILRLKKNLKSEKDILKRMDEMERKEKKVEMVLSGIGRPHSKERGTQYGQRSRSS